MILQRWPAAAAIALVSLGLAMPAQGQTELMGPLRIRDMTPFSILRLDMLPAHAVPEGSRSWVVEADITHVNTFVMSGNVRTYLKLHGGERRSLGQADIDAIQAFGEDAYYVDGEFSLLDLTLHRAFTDRSSVYLTLPVYDYTGGFLDSTVESFHDAFGLDNAARDSVARNRFQVVAALGGQNVSILDSQAESGLGDPVLGVRHRWPLRDPRWQLVVDGAVKLALRGERLFLSTGAHDYGFQASLQGRFNRQGIYFGASALRTTGRVLGVPLEGRVVPTVTAAYEVGITRHTNAVLQLITSESAVRDTSIEEIKEKKYLASLGLRSRRGPLVYGFAIIENVASYQNTPDVGLSLTLAWIAPRP